MKILFLLLSIFSSFLATAKNLEGFVLNPSSLTEDKVVLVSVKPESESDFSVRRNKLARVAEKLNSCGVSVIIFDIPFDKTSPYGELDDAMFIQTLKKYNNIILPVQETLSGFVKKPHKKFARYISKMGHVNLIKNRKHIREFHPTLKIDGKLTPAISIMAALSYIDGYFEDKDTKPEIINLQKEPLKEYVLLYGNYRLDMSADKTIPIKFFGRAGFFRKYDADDLLNDQLDSSIFADKIAIVGYMDELLQSFFQTPEGEMSRAEIIANQIMTIWQNVRRVE